MSYLPKDELEPEKPDKDGRKPPSQSRIALWIVVSGVGLYLVGSGLYGILTK